MPFLVPVYAAPRVERRVRCKGDCYALDCAVCRRFHRRRTRQTSKVEIANDISEAEEMIAEECSAEMAVECGDDPREQGIFAMEYRRLA